MIEKTKRVLIVFLALIIIVIGVLGLILPIIPGIALLVVGMLLLSMFSPRVAAWTDKLTDRYPASKAPAESIRKFIERIIGKQ